MVLVKYNMIVQAETFKNSGIAAPGNVNDAKCQTPQAKPTKNELLIIECFSKSFGSKKPLHPNSSPIGPKGSAAKNQKGILESAINQLKLKSPSKIFIEKR